MSISDYKGIVDKIEKGAEATLGADAKANIVRRLSEGGELAAHLKNDTFQKAVINEIKAGGNIGQVLEFVADSGFTPEMLEGKPALMEYAGLSSKVQKLVRVAERQALPLHAEHEAAKAAAALKDGKGFDSAKESIEKELKAAKEALEKAEKDGIADRATVNKVAFAEKKQEIFGELTSGLSKDSEAATVTAKAEAAADRVKSVGTEMSEFTTKVEANLKIVGERQAAAAQAAEEVAKATPKAVKIEGVMNRLKSPQALLTDVAGETRTILAKLFFKPEHNGIKINNFQEGLDGLKTVSRMGTPRAIAWGGGAALGALWLGGAFQKKHPEFDQGMAASRG